MLSAGVLPLDNPCSHSTLVSAKWIQSRGRDSNPRSPDDCVEQLISLRGDNEIAANTVIGLPLPSGLPPPKVLVASTCGEQESNLPWNRL